MFNRTNKADFLVIAASMKAPRIYREMITVYVQDGNDASTRKEIYCASTWREEGFISAQNAVWKFAKWLK